MLVPVMAVQVLSGLDTLWICDIYSQLIVGVLELQIMLEMIEKF